jgi:hypothetical protein
MADIPTGKNIVADRINANGNVIVGDNNTHINLKEADQYMAIEADIQKLNERFENTRVKAQKYPDDADFRIELLQIDEERIRKQEDLETLKREVLKLADDFQRIPLNTERLRIAKRHFERGEFEAARAVLDAEKMGNELGALLSEKERLHRKMEENQQNLTDKANEYLILAHLTAIDFSLPDPYKKTVEYFEQSLRAERNAENLFEYAKFLQEHNKSTSALRYYEEALQINRELAEENPSTYKSYVANTLNNLAILQETMYEHGDALANYEEALRIYRKLAEENPRRYMPNLAMTLNNLASLQVVRNDLSDALANYEEALQISRELALYNPRFCLPKVATILNNLAALQSSKNESASAVTNYEEALQINREFAMENPRSHLPKVAMTLSNLASLQADKNEMDDALTNYEESLRIYRALAVENPRTYLQDVATTLNNLANLQADRKEADDALESYKEALGIRRHLAIENPKSYLPSVAITLNNLAALQAEMNEDGDALENFLKALLIQRELASENPRTYLPDVAATLFNLGIFFKDNLRDRENFVTCTLEAVRIALEYPDLQQKLSQHKDLAVQLLQANGVDLSFLQGT